MTSKKTSCRLALRQLRLIAGVVLLAPAVTLADRERVDETRAVELGGGRPFQRLG